jgi:fructose-bisphosphate aldolase class II
VDIEFYARDPAARLALKMQVAILKVQFGEFPFESGRGDSQISQCTHRHVATDPRKAVQVENTHLDAPTLKTWRCTRVVLKAVGFPNNLSCELRSKLTILPLMIVTTSALFKLAYSHYAIGAYNINNLEQTLGLFEGCIESQAPFIIQLSKGSRKYADKRMLEAIIRTASQIYPEAVCAVHLDHGDEETCYDCIDSGFYSSVMIDASHETFEENVARTRRVVDRAHAKGVSVEAELGRLGGVEEDVKVDEGSAFLTDPKEAVEFVKESGCDSLAAAIGTSHGAYKFSGRQSLHFEVIEAIKEMIPRTPIVMHGSSSVPEDEVKRINAAGGTLDPNARGVDDEDYLPAAKLGVTKINIDTDGRLVWTRVHREFFRDHPSDFDFRPPGKIFVEEYAKFIAKKNGKLGSAGTLPEVRKTLSGGKT